MNEREEGERNRRVGEEAELEQAESKALSRTSNISVSGSNGIEYSLTKTGIGRTLRKE